jgi:SAM-dependent methyltransferase
MTFPTLVHLDSPRERPLASPFWVKGWIASENPLASASLLPASAGGPLSLTERPDVRAAKPDYPHVAGFSGLIDDAALAGGALELEFHFRDAPPFRSRHELAPVPLPPNKTRRLERIRPHLRRDLPFFETPFHFNFLSPELRRQFALDQAGFVSSHAYGPAVNELIARFPEGLILDAGAGSRREDAPNVVTLEIKPYPSTDIVAVNEQLPFADNTFDAVISCAVLEHVRDPFAAARELVRVTKRGGCIYADVPFLQPYHGYPSHYYNMTSQGLVNLFSASCDVTRTAVPVYGQPIWSLTWMLNSYLAGLPPAAREEFRALRVADLLDRPESYYTRAFVRDLPEAKRFELASVTSVWAVKR